MVPAVAAEETMVEKVIKNYVAQLKQLDFQDNTYAIEDIFGSERFQLVNSNQYVHEQSLHELQYLTTLFRIWRLLEEDKNKKISQETAKRISKYFQDLLDKCPYDDVDSRKGNVVAAVLTGSIYVAKSRESGEFFDKLDALQDLWKRHSSSVPFDVGTVWSSGTLKRRAKLLNEIYVDFDRSMVSETFLNIHREILRQTLVEECEDMVTKPGPRIEIRLVKSLHPHKFYDQAIDGPNAPFNSSREHQDASSLEDEEVAIIPDPDPATPVKQRSPVKRKTPVKETAVPRKRTRSSYAQPEGAAARGVDVNGGDDSDDSDVSDNSDAGDSGSEAVGGERDSVAEVSPPDQTMPRRSPRRARENLRECTKALKQRTGSGTALNESLKNSSKAQSTVSDKGKTIFPESAGEKMSWNGTDDDDSSDNEATRRKSKSRPILPTIPRRRAVRKLLKQRPIYNVWTDAETNALKKGFAKYGPQWKHIKDTYPELHGRDNVQLKDKHRNLVKAGEIPE